MMAQPGILRQSITPPSRGTSVFWRDRHFDFDTDGRRFYFTVDDRQSDGWVAEIAKR